MWRTDEATRRSNYSNNRRGVNNTRSSATVMIYYYYTIAILLMFCVVTTEQSVTCTGERCRLMRDVLRDPHRLTNWKPSSLNRAIHQLRAYEQLFQEDKRASPQYGPLIDVMRLR